MQHTSYGQELKSARERSGMSLQAVADALHLDPRLVEAIEVEDEKSLPAPAYVRGYIRAYAQLVRCEPDTLVARYNIQAKSEPDLIASVHSVAAIKQQRDARLMWVGTGIVVSLLMIVVGGWLLIENLFIGMAEAPNEIASVIADSPYGQLPQEPWQQPDSTTPEPEVAIALDPAVNTGSSDVTEVAPQTQTPPESRIPATPEPAPELSSSPVPQEWVPAKPVVANASTGNDKLRLAFDGISWVEVLDANGERLVYGLFDAQTLPLTVSGEAPFDITIGDANHVDISVNGQFVSTEPYIKRNNTARFTLGSPVSPQQ